MTDSLKPDIPNIYDDFLRFARAPDPESPPDPGTDTGQPPPLEKPKPVDALENKPVPAAKSGKAARRIHPFSVRLTAEERQTLEMQAKGKPLAAYIRERLLGDEASPRRIRRKPSADHALLGKVLGMLGKSRLANNLNQIAKAAHLGVLICTPDLLEDLEQACADIAAMREALLLALGFPSDGDTL